jgi:O-antigen ligase
MTRERLTFGHTAHAAVPSQRSVIATAATLAHEPVPVRFRRLETWDWGWGGLLIFSILLFFRPQDQLRVLGALHVSDAAALIGLMAMVLVNTSRREPMIRVTPELLGMAGFGLVMLVTIPTSTWAGGSMRVFTDMFIQVALIFVLMVNTITSPRRVERICWVIVLAFGYISARVIFDYMRGMNLVEGNRASGPVGGFFQNPNDLALNLATFLPLALMYVKRPGPAFKRLLCAGISVLMLLALVFTKSRGGQLAAAAMLVTFLLVSRSLTPGTILALVVAGMVTLPLLPQSYIDRMSSIVNEEKDPTGSREERRIVMEQAWQVFLDHPLTGIGAGQFQNFQQPGSTHTWRQTHNAPLQVAAEVGIFGVVAFFYLIWRAFKSAWWTRRELSWIFQPRSRKSGQAAAAPEDGLEDHERLFLQTHGAAMVACLAAWFVGAQFGSVAFNWTFYYVLGLAVTPVGIIQARRRAYVKAKALAARESAAA